MLHRLFNNLVMQGVDCLARSVMRTGSVVLTQRAKLEALSSVIRWIIKKQNNRPLHISHQLRRGVLSLMSTGDLIQLTWQPHQQGVSGANHSTRDSPSDSPSNSINQTTTLNTTPDTTPNPPCHTMTTCQGGCKSLTHTIRTPTLEH
jgi:hypothetical protein